MKKLALAILAASSFSVIADDFAGHRAGIGISSLDFSGYDYKVDAGNGVKLEYGYDFNRIFGLNVSYESNSDKESGLGYSYELEGSSLKVDTDIGYAFALDGFSIKPYGAIGLTRHSGEEQIYIADLIDAKDKFNDTSVHIGIGTRAQLDMGIYADLRLDFTSIDSMDADYFSFTVGYKF